MEGDILPVSFLPNKAVLGLHLSLPDGRIFEGRELNDGTGCVCWIYVGDIVTDLEARVMAIDREWPPDWMRAVTDQMDRKGKLNRVSRRILRDLGLDPESFK